jgi:hypothetical protein
MEVFMKSIPFFMLTATLLFAASCASSPEPTSNPEPTSSPPAKEAVKGDFASQEEANEAFIEVYNTYLPYLDLEGAQSYTVVKGDTLSGITRRFWGTENGYYFPVIMLGSSDVVQDPDMIRPGMKLTIVDLNKNLANPQCRSAIKQFLRDIADVYLQARIRAEQTRSKLLELSESI